MELWAARLERPLRSQELSAMLALLPRARRERLEKLKDPEKMREPLCAYLVAPSEKQVLNNLKLEFLRLMAAMLNCPYDALRQRQKRYRMQQLAMLMGILAAVAMIFMLMLVNTFDNSFSSLVSACSVCRRES